MTDVPSIRVRNGNDVTLREDGDYVVYWMTANRRLEWNFALQHAVKVAKDLGKPLVLLEILKADEPYSSPRFHRFILDGMAERSRTLSSEPVFHFPFVEMEAGESDGLLPAVTAEACLAVTDDFPSTRLSKVVEAAGRNLNTRLDIVDSNGVLPLRTADRIFSAAYHFRRYLQKQLSGEMPPAPVQEPLTFSRALPEAPIPSALLRRWKPWEPALRPGVSEVPASIRGGVPTVDMCGTRSEGLRRLAQFLSGPLDEYGSSANHPDRQATSGLSPYLHFGVVSASEVFHGVTGQVGWTPLRLSTESRGQREGWWGMSPAAERFLDQLITWRELGFNMAWQVPNHATYDALPAWAVDTLEAHRMDPRDHLYSYEEFLAAETHDPLWNAAQRQLLNEGVIHNYLRMLWGKKILEWSHSPREAAEIMVDLNDRYALDGQDPNSYSGIFWCLGRYDRGWPERPIYGKVRSMSSERTRKKVELEDYLKRHGQEA